MGIPLLALNTGNCLMLADYHEKAGHTEEYHTWLRVALTLQTIHDYNNGQIDETMMCEQLNTAYWGRNEDVIGITCDYIRPFIEETIKPFIHPSITELLED